MSSALTMSTLGVWTSKSRFPGRSWDVSYSKTTLKHGHIKERLLTASVSMGKESSLAGSSGPGSPVRHQSKLLAGVVVSSDWGGPSRLPSRLLVGSVLVRSWPVASFPCVTDRASHNRTAGIIRAANERTREWEARRSQPL